MMAGADSDAILSKWRATLSFGTPGITKDKTLALVVAVPIGRRPGIVASACVAHSSNAPCFSEASH